MKKRILLVMIIFSTCLSLLFAISGKPYLEPKLGTSGIPMNPPKGPSNFRYTPIHTTPGRSSSSTEVFDSSSNPEYNLAKGKYTTNEMIAVGGVSGAYKSEALDTSVKVTATCDNGFFMVSQSNPSYKRPFELYIIPKARRSYTGTHYYGTEFVLGTSKNSVEIKYSDMISEARGGNEVWFDVVLVLDGEMKPGDVLDYRGKDYPLTVSNDYSAIVTITVQHMCGGEAGQIITMTVPFTGFYETDVKPKQNDKVSMFIHALPAAGNIDMKNYERQPIAEIRTQAVYEFFLVDWFTPTPENAYALFLSSSNDPYAKGEPFKLVKDGVQFPDRTTPNNSVGYDVILKNQDGVDITYTGEEFVTSGLTESNYGKYAFLISPAGKEVGGILEGSHDVMTTKMYNYSGTVSIQIHNNAGILMEAGRYQSSIYVHVVDLI